MRALGEAWNWVGFSGEGMLRFQAWTRWLVTRFQTRVVGFITFRQSSHRGLFLYHIMNIFEKRVRAIYSSTVLP